MKKVRKELWLYESCPQVELGDRVAVACPFSKGGHRAELKKTDADGVGGCEVERVVSGFCDYGVLVSVIEVVK